MGRDHIQQVIEKIEWALENHRDISATKIMLMAGQWRGLKKALGENDESEWAMLYRLRGI